MAKVLVTGASGKLGGPLCKALREEGHEVTAAVHHTSVDVEGVSQLPLDLSSYPAVRSAVGAVDSVIHLASAKEDRDSVVDLSVRGTFNLLEACRETREIRRFVLAGGDCVNGIYFNERPEPIREAEPLTAYPGYYALSKVLEETLTTQYFHQEGIPIVNLRMSWIHTEDDILNHLEISEHPFGVPVWSDLMTEEQKHRSADGGKRVAAAIHPDGRPLIRHIVSLEDCIDAFRLALSTEGIEGETFNVAMAVPFDYREAARYAADRLGIEVMELIDPVGQDFRMDIGKARRRLGFDPRVDIYQLIDRAIEFRQSGARHRRRTTYTG